MALSDLVRNLNDINHRPSHWANGVSQFITSDGRVFVRFAHLFLESVFQEVITTQDGQAAGQAATMQAYSSADWLPVPVEEVYALPNDDAEFVYLDRLIRALHALNYLNGHLRGNLFLSVHRRHVAAVPTDHGLAFEEILKPWGLLPRQITLEMDIDAVDDFRHLQQAVGNYRKRGYHIAINRFGRHSIDFTVIDGLAPDFVKLDALLLASSRPLPRLIDRLHRSGARVVIEGVNTPGLRKGAATLGIDLLQSHGSPRLRQRSLRVADQSHSAQAKTHAA